VTKDLGFSEGKPVAAFTLYNCLVHWKIFELDKTSIFDHLIALIGNAIEVTSCSLKLFFASIRDQSISNFGICLKSVD